MCQGSVVWRDLESLLGTIRPYVRLLFHVISTSFESCVAFGRPSLLGWRPTDVQSCSGGSFPLAPSPSSLALVLRRFGTVDYKDLKSICQSSSCSIRCSGP